MVDKDKDVLYTIHNKERMPGAAESAVNAYPVISKVGWLLIILIRDQATFDISGPPSALPVCLQ